VPGAPNSRQCRCWFSWNDYTPFSSIFVHHLVTPLSVEVKHSRPIRNANPSSSESDHRRPDLRQLAHSSQRCESKHERRWTGALSDIARTLSALDRCDSKTRHGRHRLNFENPKRGPTWPFPEANFEAVEPTVRNPPNLTAECSNVELPEGHPRAKKEAFWDEPKAVN
jgi:hypothetical protein